jgi:hypothetical protein
MNNEQIKAIAAIVKFATAEDAKINKQYVDQVGAAMKVAAIAKTELVTHIATTLKSDTAFVIDPNSPDLTRPKEVTVDDWKSIVTRRKIAKKRGDLLVIKATKLAVKDAGIKISTSAVNVATKAAGLSARDRGMISEMGVDKLNLVCGKSKKSTKSKKGGHTVETLTALLQSIDYATAKAAMEAAHTCKVTRK